MPEDGRRARPGEAGRARRRRDRGSVPSPMADLPVGATFGSLVHAVLEHADPAATDFRAELLRPHRRAAGLVAGRPRRRGARRRAGRGVRQPARSAGRRPDAARPCGLPDRLRELDFELPLAGGDDAAYPSTTSGSATSRRCCGATCPTGDPVRSTPTPSTTTPTSPPSRSWATSPGRSTWCCGSTSTAGALPHRRLQDQLARRPRRAADRPRLPPGGARRGDGALRLPAPGAALHRGAAPVPALAAARLRPGDPPRRRALPLPPRHVRAGHATRRRRSRAASSRGDRRSRSSRSCPTCWTDRVGAS